MKVFECKKNRSTLLNYRATWKALKLGLSDYEKLSFKKFYRMGFDGSCTVN